MSGVTQGRDALGSRYFRCAIGTHAEVIVMVHDESVIHEPGFSEMAKAAAWLCAEELIHSQSAREDSP